MVGDLVGGPTPATHLIDARRAMETLDHAQMNALAGAYERWALTEVNISPENRTMLIQLSSDYERVAEHCGPAWTAPNPEYPSDVVAYVARLELGHSRGRKPD